MSVWLVRCGDRGKEEHRDKFFMENRVTVGYGLTHPIIDYATRTELRDSPDLRGRTAAGYDAGRLWRFAGFDVDRDPGLYTGDLVLTPYTNAAGSRVFAVGEVVSEYDFQDVGDTHPHTRSVRWHNTDIPRDGLPVSLREFLKYRSGFQRAKPEVETALRQFLDDRNRPA